MLDTGIVLAVIGAAVAAIFGGVGSCLGVGAAGTKATGVLAERPDLFGKLLLITALPGSQGVYGLLMAILILMKANLLGGQMLLWAGAMVGLAGFTSGWFQGKVAAGAIGAIGRDDSVSGKALVLAVIIETYAIFGLLAGFFIWLSV
ncbi:UNVERIFIED_CONTAM: hypothetical protein GTU68_040184 [Idotea baltica]|nr:hypothetical protein [Idotea baltica]